MTAKAKFAEGSSRKLSPPLWLAAESHVKSVIPQRVIESFPCLLSQLRQSLGITERGPSHGSSVIIPSLLRDSLLLASDSAGLYSGVVPL